MTLTNHLLAGAALATVLPLKYAVPLAFLSHFVLDACPHFGFKTIEERRSRQKLLTTVFVIDAVAALCISVYIIHNLSMYYLLVGLVAYTPDLLWIYRFFVEEKMGKIAPTKGNWFIQFHIRIQKFERPWGGIIEIAFAAVLLVIIK